jgi:hypothetical protein
MSSDLIFVKDMSWRIWLSAFWEMPAITHFVMA